MPELAWRPGAVRRCCSVTLTGWGQEDDRRRAREAGFDHHLVKPAPVAACTAEGKSPRIATDPSPSCKRTIVAQEVHRQLAPN